MALIRGLVRFPLFQLAAVFFIILFLQAEADNSLFGEIFSGLDRLVDQSVTFASSLFSVKSFTRAGLTWWFMIGYVYLACSFLLYLVWLASGVLMNVVGRRNIFWLRTTIARERGVAAYHAWVPLERIRPDHISQQEWEEKFAWPANNRPPYRPLM